MVSKERFLQFHYTDMTNNLKDRLSRRELVNEKTRIVTRFSGTSKAKARFYMNQHIERFIASYYGLTAMEEWFKAFSEGAKWLNNDFSINNPLWIPDFTIGGSLSVFCETKLLNNCQADDVSGAQVTVTLEFVRNLYTDMQLCHAVKLRRGKNYPPIVLRSKIKRMFMPNHSATSNSYVLLRLLVRLLYERWRYAKSPQFSRGDDDVRRIKLCKAKMEAYFNTLTPFEWWLFFGETTNLTELELLTLKNGKANTIS